MTTWHDRLQQAITARDKRWDELVDVTGKSKPAVYGWKPGATKRSEMMNGDNAAKVCDFLQISAMWLFHGKGPSGLDASNKHYSTQANVTELRAHEPNKDEIMLLKALHQGDSTARALLLAQASAILAQSANRARNNRSSKGHGAA